MPERGLVVVTGAAGVVGRAILPALARGGPVRAADRVAFDPPPGVDPVVGDLRREETAHRFLAGATTVVHLATRAEGKNTWRHALRGDLEMHRTVMAAARVQGVGRVVLASSLRVFQGYEQAGLRRRIAGGDTEGLDPHGIVRLPVDAPPWPRGPYATVKVMMERHGRKVAGPDMEVVVMRLGFVGPADRPVSPRAYCNYLSNRDLAQAIECAIDAPVDRSFAVFTAVSDNRWGLWDLGPGRELGFRPVDDAEQYAGGPGAGADSARWMRSLLESLADRPTLREISRLDHSLQAASRARRAGADDDEVVAALCHDIGCSARTQGHAAVSASMLSGRVSPRLVWAVRVHEDFMDRHRRGGWRQHRRYRWRWHPWYGTAARLVDQWDAPAEDPEYPSLPLTAFVPLLEATFARGGRESRAVRLGRRLVPGRVRQLLNRM